MKSVKPLYFLRFCATRWIEDESVAERALTLWPNIVKMIKHWEGLCKSRRPKNKSYTNLTKHYLDTLFPVKLQFFKDIASHLKGYLEVMQTDNPMVPFFEEALVDLVYTLMKMIVKPSVLEEANTSYKLAKVDLSNSENLIPCELVKLPTATKALLRSKVELTERKKSQYLGDCRSMLVTLLQKIQEKCQLKYAIARCAASLSPVLMVSQKEKSSNYFSTLVEKLYGGRWISSKVADLAKKEYDTLMKAAHGEHKDSFLTFKWKEDRVDSFFAELMHGNISYKNCWEIFKLIFTFSHGQASVERGFSVNKELLVENLAEESVVCQRMVYDHVISTGKPVFEIPITNDLLKSCKLAHSRYTLALEQKRSKNEAEEKSRKRKIKSEEIADVKEKKRALESCIESLNVDIEQYSIAAEKEADLSLLTKANSFRVTVQSKKETLATLEKTIVKLTEELQEIK